MALLSGLLVLVLVGAFSLCAAAMLDRDPALLPLPTLAAAALVLFAFGCLGLLAPGLWLVLALLLLGAVYAGVRAGRAALKAAAGSPAFWLFLAGSAFFWVLFAVRQPMFLLWDEFTAWGAAHKLVKVMDALYVAHPYSLTANHTFPGLSLVCYLFAAFSPRFTEWGCFAALDTLLMACAAAAAAQAGRSRWPHAALVFTGGALLPLLFEVLPAGAAGTAYVNSMADMPLGFVFGGALCLYYAAPRRRTGLLLALAPLAFLGLCKDIAFAYGLIAAFVIAVDWLFCAPHRRPGRALLGAAGAFVLAALPVLAAFLGWNRYVAYADTAASAAGSVGAEGLSYGAVLLGGVRQLLGIGREEKFAELMRLMGQAFLRRRVFLAGSGLAAVLLLALLAAAAALCAKQGARRRAPVAFAALALCFAALYAFHLILYHYNFSAQEALELKGYERYLAPYYTGWMLALLCLLGQAAAAGRRWGGAVLGGAVLAVAVLVGWRGIPVAGFWSKADSLYTVRRDVQARAAVMNTCLGWDDRVLVLSQGDDATRWYYYKLELNGTVVNGWSYDPETDTYGDGDFMNLTEESGSWLYTYTTKGGLAELTAHMEKTGCDYLLIDRSDGYLAEELGPAIEGGLTEASPAALYRFTPGERVCFAPVAVAESGVSGG